MICIKTSAFRTLGTALAALACSATALAQQGPQPKLPTAELHIEMYRVQAELARSNVEQATGMMYRTTMGTNEGMLFVNSASEPRCFWMRNTLIPLSIAFIGDDGTVINIAEMQPKSDESHCSAKPARYALEMNKGWFAKRNIKAGTKIRGGPIGK